MPALDNVYITFAVYFGFNAFVRVTIFGAGEILVYPAQYFHIRFQLGRNFTEPCRKSAQDIFDFLALVYRKRDKLVIEFENVLGFYKKSCARLRTVVHETAHLIFIFGFYGYYVSVVSYGYYAVLQILRVFRQILGKLGTYFFVEVFNSAPYRKKSVAGKIAYRFKRNYFFGNIVFENAVKIKTVNLRADYRYAFVGNFIYAFERRPRRTQKSVCVQQLRARQNGTLLRADEYVADFAEISDFSRTVNVKQFTAFFSAVQR